MAACCFSLAQSQASDLRAKAKVASEKIAEIVKQGPDASEESMKRLQELVEELKAIRKELQSISGTDEGKKAPTLSGYLQGQYQNSDRIVGSSGPYDAFRIRRLRVVFDADPKERWHLRGSFDASAGSNQQNFLLKEAWARYTAPGDRTLAVTLGQQALPLGYEIERSSFDIEFPERTILSGTLFSGEMVPGIKASYDVAQNLNVQLGLTNALLAQDPEQSDRGAGSGDELAAVGAVTYSQGTGRVRLSGFTGKRSAYTTSNETRLPEADREFAVLDAQYQTKLWKPLTLRGEAMVGRDRLPMAQTEGPVSGWHALAAVEIDRHNALAVRYQNFDRNGDLPGDVLVGYGLAYMWRFDRDLRLTLSHEIFVDALRQNIGQQRYSETVLRLSLRF